MFRDLSKTENQLIPPALILRSSCAIVQPVRGRKRKKIRAGSRWRAPNRPPPRRKGLRRSKMKPKLLVITTALLLILPAVTTFAQAPHRKEAIILEGRPKDKNNP